MAAFIETDLVLVFDHLTHTLSAIASLHTDAPDLEGRYRIAEAAIFDALERTARPSAAELAGARPGGRPGAGTDGGTRVVEPQRPVDTSLGRDAYIHAVEVAKDAIAAGEAIQVVLARRQSFDLPGRSGDRAARSTASRIYRALRRVNPSPYLFFVRTPDRSRSSARRRSCCSRSRATSSRHTRSPAPARAARTRRRMRSSPSSSSAIRRSAPST